MAKLTVWAWALAILVACGGEPNTHDPLEDVGTADASEELDAGEELDASEEYDAGEQLDAGHEEDAGEELDAGEQLDAGDADAGEDDHMPIYVPGETYYERLLERRKEVDLLPWAQRFDGDGFVLPSGAPVGSPAYLSLQRSWGMSFGEYTMYGVEGPNWVRDAGLVLFQVGPQSAQAAIQPFSGLGVIGDPATAWWGLGSGLFLAPQEAVKATYFNTSNWGGLDGHYLQIVGRGYREFPLGTLTPRQHTYEEYSEQGYRFMPYDYGAQIVVPAGSNTLQYMPVLLEYDFVADSLMVLTQHNGAWNTDPYTGSIGNPPLTSVGVSIDGVGPLMDGRAITGANPAAPGTIERFALTGAVPQTAWHWPIPLSIDGGQTITFSASTPTAPSGSDTTVQFVLKGHRLIRP